MNLVNEDLIGDSLWYFIQRRWRQVWPDVYPQVAFRIDKRQANIYSADENKLFHSRLQVRVLISSAVDVTVRDAERIFDWIT